MLTVSEAFKIFKSKLELPQSLQDKISTHHQAVRGWIESYDPGLKTKLIGSLHPKRRTRIKPRAIDTFDIDILVIMRKFERQVSTGGITPQRALDMLEEIVRKHGTYGKLDPDADHPVIYFEYADGIRVELVPAWEDYIFEPKGRGYRVPKKGRWESADYDYDAEYISLMNERSKGYLIPLIKMLKAAKRNLLPIITSYHLEILASNLIPSIVQIFDEKEIPLSYPLLVYTFFLSAKDEILRQAIIPGSKSPPADEYLSNQNREKLKQTFEDLASYCNELLSSEGQEAIKGWRKLFGEPFPTGG